MSLITQKNPGGLVVALLGGVALSAQAAVILETDFSGRTVSGTSATNITWTTNGVTNPGDLTVNNIAVDGANPGDLFDTSAAQGYFAPDNNIGNGGEWETSIVFTTLADNIALTTILWDYGNFGNSGNIQTAFRSSEYTVSISEVLGGAVVLSPISIVTTASDGIEGLLTFNTPVTLDANTEYSLVFNADGVSAGSNTSIDALTVNGDLIAVPEPSSLLLLSLGALAFGRRRR
ncbi:MAG: PEP-CTERM sorting domain-containing protein [Verrucomicrobiota bacterium JB023]|nr:PEP-CTERM sorting domain-containing protein [Verrucomicrobiota bacterium JB023]